MDFLEGLGTMADLEHGRHVSYLRMHGVRVERDTHTSESESLRRRWKVWEVRRCMADT